MFKIFILYALFGSVFIIEKQCLNYGHPFFLVGARMALAGCIMLGVQYFSMPYRVQFEKRHLWMLLRLALFNIYFTNIFEIWALSRLDAFATCFIYSLSPFLAALLSYCLFSEKLSKNKWIGLSIGCGGFIPILIDKVPIGQIAGLSQFFSCAEIIMLFAVICSVYGWISLKQLIYDEGYSALAANGYSMLIGGVMALVHSFLVEEWDPVPVSEPIQFAGFLAVLVIVSNLVCYNLYGTLLKTFSATFLSFAGFTTPLFTAVLGWIFLDEKVTFPFIVAAGIVFLGLLVFSKDELKTQVA